MRVLGIDLGAKRVGLAISDPGRRIASPHKVMQRSGDEHRDHREIADIVAEWGVEHVVVGLPLSLDGSMGPAATAASAEIERLADHLSVPVETYDERLTTVRAEQILAERGVSSRAQRQVIDMVAAAVLLQAWLDGQRQQTSPEQAT